MTVKDVDKGFKKEIQRLTSVSNLEAVVGVLGRDVNKTPYQKNSTTVLDVALAHEYGAPAMNLPKRSFLRSAYLKHKKAIEAFLGKQYEAFANGRATDTEALGRTASFFRSKVLEQFRAEGDPKWPGLKQSTLRRRYAKISPTQAKQAASRGIPANKVSILRDTGNLIQSIHSVVRRKDGKL